MKRDGNLYNKNIFQEVKEYLKPTEVAERYLSNSKYKNGSLWYKSPFRNEKTPSFCVNNKKGIHDFGNNKHYDIISFVQELFGESVLNSVDRLIKDFNLPIKTTNENKSKPKFEYDKQYAKYKYDRKKEIEISHEKSKCFNQLYEAATCVYKYCNNLKLFSKDWNFEIYDEYLLIIYRNEMYFDYIVDLFNDNIDFIYENKSRLKSILERGIIYMNFDNISLLAYKEEEIPNSSSNIELLTYYMLKDLYIKYYKKQINDENAKNQKQKIKTFYEKQTSLEKFDFDLSKQIANNIRKSENEIINIIKLINQNSDIKPICDIAINCISHLTDNTVLKRIYEEKY